MNNINVGFSTCLNCVFGDGYKKYCVVVSELNVIITYESLNYSNVEHNYIQKRLLRKLQWLLYYIEFDFSHYKSTVLISLNFLSIIAAYPHVVTRYQRDMQTICRSGVFITFIRPWTARNSHHNFPTASRLIFNIFPTRSLLLLLVCVV